MFAVRFTDDILQDLHLPSEINELSEETRVDIAYVIEEGNCLQAEVDLASRRCRQLVFAAHKQALRADRLNAELSTVRRNISTRLQDVVVDRQEPCVDRQEPCVDRQEPCVDRQAPCVDLQAPYADLQAPCVDASSCIGCKFGFSPSRSALANASIQTDERCRA